MKTRLLTTRNDFEPLVHGTSLIVLLDSIDQPFPFPLPYIGTAISADGKRSSATLNPETLVPIASHTMSPANLRTGKSK